MSIASEIQRISGNVSDAYTAANAKGATMPVSQNSDNLASTIATIPTGTTPTGTKSITANGIYDVTDFASADVQVPTTAPNRYLEYTVDSNGKLVHDTSATSLINLNGVESIDDYILANAYTGNTSITGTIDLSTIKSVGQYGLYNTFKGCTGITGVNLSNLQDISNSSYSMGYCFQNCTNLTGALDLSSVYIVSGSNAMAYCFANTNITSVDLSGLKSIEGNNSFSYTFSDCTSLISADLSGLIKATSGNCFQQMFARCTNLTTVNLSSLIELSSNYGTGSMFIGSALTSFVFPKLYKLGTSSCLSSCFQNCNGLTSVSFPSLAYTDTNYNNTFANMLIGCSNVTVHFPAEWQSTMSSWSNVTNGFGGTNTTVLFDLPNVTTLDLSNITEVNLNSLLSNFDYYNYFPNITSVDFRNLETIGGISGCQSMFRGASSITSFNLSSLKTISASNNGAYYMFSGSGVSGVVNLSKLETISGTNACNVMFSDCTGITGFNLDNLIDANVGNACASMFYGCTNLTGAVSLPSLESVGNSAFSRTFSNTGVTSVSFPALKTVFSTGVFNYMLDGVTECTVHFPSNLSNKNFNCGGTRTTVLYDLPATNTLTGADTEEYRRNPKYDTATALSWYRVGTDRFTTQYYTSGTTDPQVNDTIYSDSACTTSVTTISSIS